MKHLAVSSLSVAVLSSLAGCGVSNDSSVKLTGAVLGWDNNLYILISPIDANYGGKKLGIVSYHGSIAGMFTVYQFSGSSPTKDVVFALNGQYYKAVVEKSD